DLAVSVDFDCFTTDVPDSPASFAMSDNLRLAQRYRMRAPSVVEVGRRESQEGDVQRADVNVEFRDVGDDHSSLRSDRTYLREGPFLYTFVFHGETTEVEREKASAQRILASFELLPAAHEAEQLARVAQWHNASGRLEGNRYSDPHLGVYFDGPAGWAAANMPGLGRFRVSYRVPGQLAAGMQFCGLESQGMEVFDADTVEEKIHLRDALLPDDQRRGRTTIRRQSVMHANGIDSSFEVESEWVGSEGEPWHEILVAIPNGRMLYVVQASAPKATFEKRLPEIRAAINSFRHEPGR
ncbi:MAG TPA: hypothetical protein VKE69_00170, partial [Planctomycetota bacterium]|nr:hypothetical protein [Planctomycetota bacterium]